MFSIQEVKYRIHCEVVCNKFYIDNNYKRHLKSNEHINNFIKKQKVTNIILSKTK